MSTQRFVAAEPYAWPWNGELRPDNTVLIVIDMQTDFCGKGGYIDLLGYDIGLTRACIGPIQKVLEKMRAGGYHIMHTREGHRPDLADPRLPRGGRLGRHRHEGRPPEPEPLVHLALALLASDTQDGVPGAV